MSTKRKDELRKFQQAAGLLISDYSLRAVRVCVSVLCYTQSDSPVMTDIHFLFAACPLHACAAGSFFRRDHAKDGR